MMVLRHLNDDGNEVAAELGDAPITIGRSKEADITIADEKASRFHCGIRKWDDDYVVRDLKSRNGTFVNGSRITISEVHPGDTIQVGSRIFTVEEPSSKGANTMIREVEEEMLDGRGYHTILKQIVDDVGGKGKAKGPGRKPSA